MWTFFPICPESCQCFLLDWKEMVLLAPFCTVPAGFPLLFGNESIASWHRARCTPYVNVLYVYSIFSVSQSISIIEENPQLQKLYCKSRLPGPAQPTWRGLSERPIWIFEVLAIVLVSDQSKGQRIIGKVSSSFWCFNGSAKGVKCQREIVLKCLCRCHCQHFVGPKSADVISWWRPMLTHPVILWVSVFLPRTWHWRSLYVTCIVIKYLHTYTYLHFARAY